MENELVHSKKNDVFCDSRIIAEKFGKQHNKIVDKIEWLITKLKEDNEIHSLFGGAEIPGKRGTRATVKTMKRL